VCRLLQAARTAGILLLDGSVTVYLAKAIVESPEAMPVRTVKEAIHDHNNRVVQFMQDAKLLQCPLSICHCACTHMGA